MAGVLPRSMAASIEDRTIPLFDRERRRYSNGGTYMGFPFLQDARQLGGQDVAIIGVPLDAGTTFRSGTRWGPLAMRTISSLHSGYNYELGVDLHEALDVVDIGDVTVIPANLEKSFDQIDKAIRAGVPAKTSWYFAFSLMVTLVWLYLEILRLLSYLRQN